MRKELMLFLRFPIKALYIPHFFAVPDYMGIRGNLGIKIRNFSVYLGFALHTTY
jgi:hypothetical protein